MLRVFEASGSRALIHKVFLKQRLTSVACIDACIDDCIDDVWNDIPDVDVDAPSDHSGSSHFPPVSGLKKRKR